MLTALQQPAVIRLDESVPRYARVITGGCVRAAEICGSVGCSSSASASEHQEPSLASRGVDHPSTATVYCVVGACCDFIGTATQTAGSRSASALSA